MYVTEASCDACPRHCRAEVFRVGKTSCPPMWGCVLHDTGATAAWVVGPQIPTSEPTIVTNTFRLAPAETTRDRVLLACEKCSAPCLLETQGPVSTGALRCVAGFAKQEWRRTL